MPALTPHRDRFAVPRILTLHLVKSHAPFDQLCDTVRAGFDHLPNDRFVAKITPRIQRIPHVRVE